MQLVARERKKNRDFAHGGLEQRQRSTVVDPIDVRDSRFALELTVSWLLSTPLWVAWLAAI